MTLHFLTLPDPPDSSNDLQEQVESSMGGSPYRTAAVMPPSEAEIAEARVLAAQIRQQELRQEQLRIKTELSVTQLELAALRQALSERRLREQVLGFLAFAFFTAAAISVFCHLINHHEHLFR
jgi:hypothetical protein